MFYKILFSCILLFALAAGKMEAQSVVSGEVIVELRDAKALRLLLGNAHIAQEKMGLKAAWQLIPRFNYWLLQYDSSAATAPQVLEWLRQQPQVLMAQPNHRVQLRSPQNTIPNDPQFYDQWQYINSGLGGGAADADLDAPEAWDITTGGSTITGEEIVIAIIDDGLDLLHPDIYDNVWRNTGEIDNNNLDDDLNGYTDDIWGWNSVQNNDDIGSGSAGQHGTAVAGIIGAKGNNGIGVTGVNWDCKMLIVRNHGNTTEANVLASYGYALTQRRLYNESNGAKGAFVVATNASWGINYGQPSNAPLWCAFYDTLGKYGILNVAATANLNINVDTQGDLPTACPSDFLLSVTNVNRLGDKLFSAAYGSTSIDLGAYGESVYTAVYSSGYGTFGGTSAAAPHVTGCVGLIYAAACSDFLALAKVYPQQAALLAKQWIMDGVVPENTLSATVSGGCLNLNNTLQLVVNNCPADCYPPYNFVVSGNTGNSLTLSWQPSSSSNSVWLRYREVGSSTWASTTTTGNSFNFSGLNVCANYEVQLVARCNGQDSDTLQYNFQTEGCCLAPLGLAAAQITETTALVTWSDLVAVQHYLLEYRALGTQVWSVLPPNTNTQMLLSGLYFCTYYEARVRALCSNGDTTDYTHVYTFTTAGCQNCFSVNYCDAQGVSSNDDWIQRFVFGSFDHVSGNNGGQYNHTAAAIEAYQNTTYTVQVYQGAAYLEYVRVWADWNQDGDFDDAYELATEGNIPYVASFTGNIHVPAAALTGVTRLRVAMQWNSSPSVCGNINYGEVEDYCLQVIPSSAIAELQGVSDTGIKLYPNPFEQQFTLECWLEQPIEAAIFTVSSVSGQQLFTRYFDHLPAGAHQFTFSEIADFPAGIYFVRWSDDQHQWQLKVVKE